MKILLVFYVACAFVTGQDIDYEKDPEESEIYEDEAKDHYFRYVRAYEGDGVLDEVDKARNLPRPGGFRLLRERRRRDADKELEKLAEEELGRPLELEELEAENSTEMNYALNPKNDIVINDFIRFKRDAEEVTEKSEKVEKSDDGKEVDIDVDSTRPKREHERSGKMLLSTGEPLPEGSREPRGATKEQWIKQPYPVQTTNPHRDYDDNIPSPSETARAPRVHFVTQRRSESAPPLVYHSYDRDGRSRDLNRQSPTDRDGNRDVEQGYYPRPPRHYNPQTPSQNYPYRPDPYYHRDERDRRQDYDYLNNNNRYDEDRPAPAFPKPRRIIYYATLPEVVRTPPNVDLRDRYNYRERYDNRYVTSPPLSVGTGSGENYRFRNGNPYSKSRYDEASKTAYPTKVSTDVNVREVKKNPERRIYSEADRRYAYKGPSYHHEDGSYDRN